MRRDRRASRARKPRFGKGAMQGAFVVLLGCGATPSSNVGPESGSAVAPGLKVRDAARSSASAANESSAPGPSSVRMDLDEAWAICEQAAQAVRNGAAPAVYDAAIAALERATGSRLRLEQNHGFGSAPRALAFKPDGTLVVATRSEIIAIAPGDLRTHHEWAPPETAWRAVDFALSPDGKLHAHTSYFGAGPVTLRDTETAKVLGEVGSPSEPWTTALAFSSDSRRLGMATSGGRLKIWDVSLTAAPRLLVDDASKVRGLAFSSDGSMLASGEGLAGSIRDAGGGAPIARVGKHPSNVEALAFLAGDEVLITGDNQGNLRSWQVESGAPIRGFAPLGKRVDGIVALADGRRFLTGSREGARIYHLDRADPVVIFEMQGAVVSAVAISTDQTQVAVGTSDRAVAWSDAGGKARRWSARPKAHLRGLAFTAKGELWFGADRTLRRLDLSDGTLRITHRDAASLTGLAVVPARDTRLLVAREAELSAYAIRDGIPSRGFAYRFDGVKPFQFGGTLPSVRQLTVANGRVAALARGHAFAWDLKTERVVLRLPAHSATHLALSGDATRIAIADLREISVIDVPSAAVVRSAALTELTKGFTSVTGMAFAADGRELLLGDRSGLLVYWDLASGGRRHETLPHGVSSLRAFPAVGLTAIGLATGDVLLRFEGRAAPLVGRGAGCCVQEIALAPDSRTLAAIYTHGSIGLWALEAGPDGIDRVVVLGVLHPLSNVDAGYALWEDGRFTLLGTEPEGAREALRCGVGKHSLPLEACAARYASTRVLERD